MSGLVALFALSAGLFFAAASKGLAQTSAQAVRRTLLQAAPLQQVSPPAASSATSRALSQNAMEALRRNLIQQNLNAQALKQQAARAAAATQPSSFNGLVAGGLVPDSGLNAQGAANPVTTWTGAKTPTQTVADGRHTISIDQTEAHAILNWNSFNVGSKTTLAFDQKGNASWVALNRVVDPHAQPSQILGQVRADGSVYVINQNGIVFGAGSQVNVGALIASTATLSDTQFLNAGIYSTVSGSIYTPSFTGATNALTVKAGALIETHAPTEVTSGGGFVLLMGKDVTNAGVIVTPKGQTQVAAGTDFALRPGYGTDANQFSTTRGNEIAPSGSGVVTNEGLILAQQGDITLAGRTIEQSGILISTTSVNTRGTIHLSGGGVTLGASSLTAILPELDSKETALDSQRGALIAASDEANLLRAAAIAATWTFSATLSPLADRLDQSRIEITASGDVTFKGASLTQAQGGQVAVSAGGRIFAETGAVIDVSGVSDVLLPMAANTLEVNIQGSELRDSPLNRDSAVLMNANVFLDARDLILVPAGTGGYDTDRYYTKGGLLEVGGYLGKTAHSIGEWAALGGAITLSAPEVVAQQGSVFDVSGGAVSYEGGVITTTNLLGADGRVYSIAAAPAGLQILGVGQGFVREHAHWNVKEVWLNPLGIGRETARYEEGYTVGRDAGRLTLSTPTSIFEGDILAEAIQGRRQTTARPANVTDGYKLTQTAAPLSGTLAIGQYGALGRTGVYDTTVRIGDIPNVTSGISARTPLAHLGRDTGSIWLDAAHLSAQGLGGLDIATKGGVAIESGLTLADGSKVSLVAPVIDIAANITARGGGSVTASNQLVTRLANGSTITTNVTDLLSDGVSHVTLRAGATIDTRGLWTNALTDPNNLSGLAFIDGGSVTLRSTGDVTLEAGSLIDASSGAAILRNGKTQGGAGGDIALIASTSTDGSTAIVSSDQGRLVFDGKVRSYGVTKGGTLTLESGSVVVIGDQTYDLGASMDAGQILPVDVILTKDVVWPAGAPLPASATLVMTRTIPAGNLENDVSIPANTSNSLVLSTDLVVKPGGLGGMFYLYYETAAGGAGFVYDSVGGTIPAGSKIGDAVTFKAGKVTVGAGGLDITAPVTFYAGDTAPADITFHAGDRLAQNSVLPAAISFQPFDYLHLSPDLFNSNSGFSGYNVRGGAGVVLADNTVLRPTMPVYRVSSSSFAAPTVSNPSPALELWTPPLYSENPIAGTLTQRGGVDVTLTSHYTYVGPSSAESAGWVYLGKGASIEVDPGRSVTLGSGGQITVEGSIVAPGGAISLLETYAGLGFVRSSGPVKTSFLIGDSAVLDVSARAYTAVDLQGRRYGVAPDGGTIYAGRQPSSSYDASGLTPAADVFIITRPGSVLDASGASAVIDAPTGAGFSFSTRPTLVASNGGAISLSSYDGILAEGVMRAASGGAGAGGGALSLMMETPYYSYENGSYAPDVSAAVQVGRMLTIGQSSVPGAMLAGIDPRTVKLAVGQGGISANAITAGGFDSVSLGARDAIVFDGDVGLSVGRSLRLNTSAVYDTVASGKVSLNAPYVLLDGPKTVSLPSSHTQMPSKLPASVTGRIGGGFAATADLIDVRNSISTHFANTSLTSATDLRFLAGTSAVSGAGAITNLVAANGNMQLTAEQVYPATGANAFVRAGGVTTDGVNYTYLPGATLTISSVGGLTPALPYSVFAAISLLAPNVHQGGIVRAPLGTITLGMTPILTTEPDTVTELHPGSITSVSAAGLVMPYGGTVDDVTWTVNGSAPITVNILTGEFSLPGKVYTQGITLNGVRVVGDAGATLDLSGGGMLTGAGFVSGRGGSVDVLTTPLVNANPANTYSAKGNQVYAIVPGAVTAPAAAGYASAWTGDLPGIGQQIEIPDGVPGLPKGAYRLMPANYALLPGAFCVELGATTTQALPGVAALGNGSYAVSGYQSVANTAIRDALPTQLIVTPGAAVRTYSQYDETSYSAYQRGNAATFGALRPLLEADGKFLTIKLGALASGTSRVSALVFDGHGDFTAEEGGYDGSLILMTASNRKTPTASSSKPNTLQIIADGSATVRSDTVTTVLASAIDAIGASNLYLGGIPALQRSAPAIKFNSGGYWDVTTSKQRANDVTVESAVALHGARVVLAGGAITLQDGVTIDTRGYGIQAPDSSSGYAFGNMDDNYSNATSLLVVSNGDIAFDSTFSSYADRIIIGDGVSLLSDGAIGFIAKTNPTFLGTPKLGAKTLGLAASSINIGSDASLAAASLPLGLNLTPGWLDGLLANVANLSLAASDSVNFYGSIDLNMGAGRTLVLTTPAIYGAGGAGDSASLTVGTLVWNGVVTQTGADNEGKPLYGSAKPGAIAATPGGHGAGSGSFTVNAADIVLGYPAGSNPEATSTLDRLMLGFSTVAFNASDKIVANNKGTLSVYQSGPDPSSGFAAKTYAGTGGALNLVTPLLTGEAGSILNIYAGGDVSLKLPMGASPSTAQPAALGAEIGITSAGAANIDMAFWLPSGKLGVTAAGDITFGANSRLNLSGQAVQFFDVTKYTWGGDVNLESTYGNIVQAAGSVIDISAGNNDAGTLTLTATGAGAGLVTLGGALRAGGGAGSKGGGFDIRAQRIGDPANLTADFAALNTRLTGAGFTESRSFDLKQGNLVIGDEVKAHAISVSVDAGSLTVNGTVDASGSRVGSIVLAARDDLTVNGLLDAHGAVVDRDSQGAPIAANNSARIELTSSAGTLRLNPHAAFDLSTPDGASYGILTLNARRTGSNGAGAPANATGGDVAISAAGPLGIRGARSIVLNGFARYTNAPVDPTDPNGQIITQDFLNLTDQDSTAFQNAAFANSDLQGRIAGLTAYGSAFHLRPGVEIDSATPNGNLTVSGDIDLSGYRYGPNAGRDPASAAYGAGEAMSLVIRAGGDLKVKGSISDGFASRPGTPATYGAISDIADDPTGHFYADWFKGSSFYSLSAPVVVLQDWVVPDPGYRFLRTRDVSGLIYAPGTTVPAGTILSSTAIPEALAGSTVGVFGYVVSEGVPAAPATANTAVALPAGSQAASLRLAAGADLAAADRRVLQAHSALNGAGNMLLSDHHTTVSVSGSITTVPAASVLRTGAGDLDLLAGGDLSLASIYNVSTNGGGTPADLTVAAQGDLSGQILSGYVGYSSYISSYVTNWLTGNKGTAAFYDGFTGFGALGGGRVAIHAGGDAGRVTDVTLDDNYIYHSTGLVVAATSGDVTVNIGGRLNPKGNDVWGTVANSNPDLSGVFTALRGDLTIKAGAIGVLPLVYGRNEINDPRGANYASAALVVPKGAITVVAGDGATLLQARGDLLLGTIGAQATADYWRDTTSVSLFSAGGNVTPITAAGITTNSLNSRATFIDGVNTNNQQLPPIFSAAATSGSLYYGGIYNSSSYRSGMMPVAFRLMASPAGSLELLAMDSIYGAANTDPVRILPPARWEMSSNDSLTLHNGDTNPIRVYAVNGDLVNVVLGQSYTDTRSGSNKTNHIGAKAARVLAGGDIVNFGRAGVVSNDPNQISMQFPSFILNTNDTDVSMIRAGGNIYYLNVNVAGPGSLEVTAGGNLYQGDKGSIVSLGALAQGDNRPGTSTAVQAGAGEAGPDWAALAALYLNPANLADLTPGHPLADQPGKVAHTYEAELTDWLKIRYGYKANEATGALAYFAALAPEQQRVFLRDVYYAELLAGGREYNDPASPRYGSYLRGRAMIAALFPDVDATGNPIARGGNFTQFGGSGIQTRFGGDIQMLVPAGQTVVGIEGQAPPSTAGLITMGSGNIQLYSKGSILLGLSRIMTAFGGNILAWSAEGDINAGRGSKTTVVYTPAKRVYDAYGNVTLSPVTSSSGAGIATLNPIPEVAPGDIDLIAPLGAIDAGEAGIRSSGNINLVARQILNAANIAAQGNTAGIPLVQLPNIGALTSSGGITTAATQTIAPTQKTDSRPSIIIVEILGYGGGNGETPAQQNCPEEKCKANSAELRSSEIAAEYNPQGTVQIIGVGPLDEHKMKALTHEERKGL